MSDPILTVLAWRALCEDLVDGLLAENPAPAGGQPDYQIPPLRSRVELLASRLLAQENPSAKTVQQCEDLMKHTLHLEQLLAEYNQTGKVRGISLGILPSGLN